MAEVAPDAQWQIWYQDMFDRECPRQVVAEGTGLVAGLCELWSRHLFETLQTNGQRGFSRFNLWWRQPGRSVEIDGDRRAMSRLREWVYGDEEQVRDRYVEGGESLLGRVAEMHARLVLGGETGEAILAAARDAEDCADLLRRLAQVTG
jgi:hypothetical protein